MSLYELKSLKYNKINNIKRVLIIIKTIDQLKTIEVKDEVEDIIRLIRSYISNPFRL